MNNHRETFHDVGTRIAGAARRKKVVTGAVLLMMLLIAALAFFGLKRDDKAEASKEKAHEETGVITLTREAQQTAGIEVRIAALEDIAAPVEATAGIELNNDRVAKISARTSGRLVKLVATQGETVRAGQALAYFDSPELGQAWAEYAKAKSRVEAARKNLQREETLFAKKISPEKDVIKARQELGEAEADLSFADEKFHLLGVDIEQFEKNHAGQQHPLIAVSSPISGVVIERTATQGEVVSPDKTIFTVADLSALWVMVDVYEKDLSRVRTGTAVKVATNAYPDKSFKGIISYVGDVMDDKTRTVKARVAVENNSRLLKPGMFATVTIEARGVQAEQAIMLPEEAVFLDGTRNFVFVETAPGTFSPREIAVGRVLAQRVEIVRGLEKGETVAVKGAFILKSELKKSELVD